MQFEKIFTYIIGLFFLSLVIITGALLFGCAEYKPLTPGVYYKRDMAFSVTGIPGGEFQGVTVLPQRSEYEFTIEPKSDSPDLLIMRSCHREDSFEKSQKSFLFIPIGDNKYKYTYKPVIGVETGRVCPLRGDAYHEEKNNSQHSWLFCDFEAPQDGYTILAELTCNSVRDMTYGVAACQARVGLVQTIQFSEEIRWAKPQPPACSPWIDKGGNRWELSVNSGECLYHAYNKNKDLFRITTIGFHGIHLRRGF